MKFSVHSKLSVISLSQPFLFHSLIRKMTSIEVGVATHLVPSLDELKKRPFIEGY
jgi:hypothetical protein